MAFGSREIIQLFRNVKAPYNISLPASKIACAALSSSAIEIVKCNIRKIENEKQRLLDSFKTLDGLGRVLGGNHANFILVQVLHAQGKPSNEAAFSLYQYLANKMGIVVRFRGNEYGCLGCLRITIGTENENSLLL